ncbi:M56 family metallopeptidase [Kordiimonas lacus]|uniref:BlaR1 peptidase M56 n=1 Tax=Kordiimonas lacus TaxID=637679 RepID=A0A1G7DPJ0_9PROT|nr:M56 family metallopeptidase [Kordiimonas lacus]SDE52725.1 BlaR1 peptidase M56 [Kordiimonas lacus]
MFDLFFDMPALTLVLKFMVASSVLLGAVWLMEKTRLLNTPDLADMAWKLAIAGSFVALLPIGDWISKPITIQHEKTSALVDEFNEGRPLAGMVPMIDPLPQDIQGERTALPARRLPPSQQEMLDPLVEQPQEQQLPATNQPLQTSQRALPRQTTLWDFLGTLRTKELAALTWAMLAGVALLLLLGGYAFAIKGLGSRLRVPPEHDSNKALRAICTAAGIKHVPYLSRSSDIKSPVCLPRREICLPDWAFDDLPESELNSLLAHEVAHMVRRDPHMLMIMQALSRLFFFQPLFLLARKRLSDIAELSADEWAATHLADAKSVAAALYTCATKIHQTRQIQWGLAMAGDKSMLKFRVERLIGATGQPFRKSGMAAKGAVATGLLAITLGLPSIQFAGALSAEMPTSIMASSTAHPDTPPSPAEIEAEMRRSIEEARAKVAERARVMAKEAKETGHPDAPTEEQIAEEMRVAIAQAEAQVSEEARLIAESAESFGLEMSSHDEDGHVRRHITDVDGNGMMTWNDGKREIKIRWDGDFTLTDNDEAIASMAEGAMLDLRSKSGGKTYRARIENPGGKLETTYWKNGKKTGFDKEGEKWLAETLLLLVREVGLNAEARITRIMNTKGTSGVVKEIEQIDSDYVARVYASHLVNMADLSRRELKDLADRFAKMDGDYDMRLALSLLLDEPELDRSVMPKIMKAARAIDSDYELRLLLTPYIARFGADNKTMEDLIDVARSIESDYEMRLLLSSAVSGQSLSDNNLERLANVAASEMESDYELRLLLSSFVEQLGQSRKATTVVIKAIAKISSDYEKRLALGSVVSHGAFDNQNWLAAIEAATTIDSDYDKRLVLSEIKPLLPEDKKIQEAFSKAVAGIDSDYERKLLSTGEKKVVAEIRVRDLPSGSEARVSPTGRSASGIRVATQVAVSDKALAVSQKTKVMDVTP